MTHASRAESASSSVDERSARTFEGLRNLVARVTPWLIDVGSWIFGGLTAINLIVISALITIGPRLKRILAVRMHRDRRRE